MKFIVVEFPQNIPDRELINDVIAVSKKLGKNTVTIQNYLEHGKYHPNTLQSRFKSWFDVMKIAGLEPSRSPINIDEELLFKNLENVWIKLDKQPSYKKMKPPLSLYGGRTYSSRFGTWMNALRRFVEYQNSKTRGSAKVQRKIKRSRNKTCKGNGRIKRTPRDVSVKLRLSVFVRDAFQCQACGKSPFTHPKVILHCDHIRPWSKGGETRLFNLQTLCLECNLAKGNKLEKP